jgi:hypothetical protein
MPRPSRNNGERRAAKGARRLWFIGIIILLGSTAGILGIAGVGWDRRSADERLAEIEAARAIPDAENAALIYSGLLQDPNAASLSDRVAESPFYRSFDRARHEPWPSKDHPELAAWVKEHQYIIDRLLQAAQFEQCRFPISIDLGDLSEMDRASPMRQWGFLLSITANNDLAEGRTAAALAKWQCLLRMGGHLRQQPNPIDYLLADAISRLALESMAHFVVSRGATESNLQEIEALPLPTAEDWAEDLKEIRLVEKLRYRKVIDRIGVWDRLKDPDGFYCLYHEINSGSDETQREIGSYRRCISIARGVQILIALRRCRNATGRWPASLDEIGSSLPEEILTDPLNKGAFVYQPAADTFRLYSRGPNNIDEDGKWDPDAGPDDWPIWPPRGIVSPGSTDGETP